jgi:hypothetical protein
MTAEKFRVAFSRDFLNDTGGLAYGDVGLQLLEASPLVNYHFLDECTEVITPQQIAVVYGLAVIYPRITAATFAQGAERLLVIGHC